MHFAQQRLIRRQVVTTSTSHRLRIPRSEARQRPANAFALWFPSAIAVNTSSSIPVFKAAASSERWMTSKKSSGDGGADGLVTDILFLPGDSSTIVVRITES